MKPVWKGWFCALTEVKLPNTSFISRVPNVFSSRFQGNCGRALAMESGISGQLAPKMKWFGFLLGWHLISSEYLTSTTETRCWKSMPAVGVSSAILRTLLSFNYQDSRGCLDIKLAPNQYVISSIIKQLNEFDMPMWPKRSVSCFFFFFWIMKNFGRFGSDYCYRSGRVCVTIGCL